MRFSICTAALCMTACGGQIGNAGPAPTDDGGNANASVDAAIDSGCPSCGGKITLFGGYDPNAQSALDDTWEWDGTAWTQRNVPGPSPRSLHAMATLNGKVVLFGGGSLSSGQAMGDTWEWDGNTWTQRNVSGPSSLVGHAMATLNGKVVMFGGMTPALEPSGDTWEWDGSAWTLRATSGPSARSGHVMATLNGKVVLYGGQTSSGVVADEWEWDGTAWTQQPVYGTLGYGPGSRKGGCMAVLAGKVVLFGGEDPATASVSHPYLGDTCEWDGGGLWAKDTIPSPSERREFAMTNLHDKVTLFGGDVFNGGAGAADTWEWDGSAWIQRNVRGPRARNSARDGREVRERPNRPPRLPALRDQESIGPRRSRS